jgi:hypothetical protein
VVLRTDCTGRGSESCLQRINDFEFLFHFGNLYATLCAASTVVFAVLCLWFNLCDGHTLEPEFVFRELAATVVNSRTDV